MKHILLVFFAFAFGIITYAQSQYEVSGYGSNKILKGIITRDLLEKDSAFTWYKANQAGYKPNASTLNVLNRNRDKVQLLIFGGTWSNSSKYIIPKLFTLLDAASFPQSQVTLVGVDQQKKSIANLCEELHIDNLPTVIIFKDGKEAGRIVDFKEGEWDKEIGDIVTQTK